MVAPLFVDRDGHRTWFKWHRARRRAGDPVFTRTRILEGLRLGDLELLDHHIGRSDEGCDAPEHAANLAHRPGERRASITLRACSGDS